MAIRIQLRRDTAANWAGANPVLLAGEIGIETDTNKFKIGNGNNWNDITVYANVTPDGLTSSLSDYLLVSDRGAANGVASLNSSTKVPNSQIDSTYYSTVTFVTESVNTLDTNLTGQIDTINTTLGGIATDISDINTAAGTLASTVSGHTTDISTLNLEKAPLSSPTFTGTVVLPSTTSIGDVSSTEISYVNGVTSGIQAQIDSKIDTTSFNSHSNATTSVHGIADTSALATKTYADSAVSTHEADTTNIHGIADTSALATKTYADSAASSAVGTHEADTTSIHGIADTSKLVTTDATSQTISGSLTVTGNLTIQGTTTTVNATDLEITDPLIYIATGNSGNANDIGVVGHATVTGTYQHMGIVRDHSDGKWKLFSGVTTEPTNTIAFGEATYDTLKAGNVEVSGVIFSDGTQTKEGVPSRTPIISKTASYTLSSLSERDSMIEVSSSSPTTITIPTNASVAFPIGASIDISQISTGQVTIAGDTGVTVNATPGLKLRTQWSTATLFKRGTNSWLVYGDLTA